MAFIKVFGTEVTERVLAEYPFRVYALNVLQNMTFPLEKLLDTIKFDEPVFIARHLPGLDPNVRVLAFMSELDCRRLASIFPEYILES